MTEVYVQSHVLKMTQEAISSERSIVNEYSRKEEDK
jgi:hypothetical protein